MIHIVLELGAPNKNHPAVQEAIRATAEAAAKHNKYVMIGINPPWAEEARKYTAMGCRMIEIGHDYSVLGRAWQEALNQARDA